MTWSYWGDDPSNDGPTRPVDDFTRLLARINLSSLPLGRTIRSVRFDADVAHVSVGGIDGGDIVTVEAVPFSLTPSSAAKLLAIPTGLDRTPSKWYDPWDDYPSWQFDVDVPSWWHTWQGVLWDEPTCYHLRERPLYAHVRRLSLVHDGRAELEFASLYQAWLATLLFEYDVAHYGMLIYEVLVNGVPADEVPGVRLRRR